MAETIKAAFVLLFLILLAGCATHNNGGIIQIDQDPCNENNVYCHQFNKNNDTVFINFSNTTGTIVYTVEG